MLTWNRRGRIVAAPFGGRAIAYPYMTECFLRSRTESHNPSNVDFYDEDVNVYIVDLLCMLLDPIYYMQVQKYVANTDSDVFEKIRGGTDKRLRYWVYKANADHLLVSLGIFSSPDGSPGAKAVRRRAPSREASGRAKLYYEFARSYCEQLMSGSKGVAEVLGKLSLGFDKYVDILNYMSGEYLNIINVLSDGEMFHLQRDIEKVREEEYVRQKYDELLDYYLEWKRTRDSRLLAVLKAVCDELKVLDPAFKLDIPQPVPY